jgi:beta-glucosidase
MKTSSRVLISAILYIFSFLLTACSTGPSSEFTPRIEKVPPTAVTPADWPRITSKVGRDPKLEAEVAALVAKMTLAEKLGQMVLPDIDFGKIVPEDFSEYHLGGLLNGGAQKPGGDLRAPVDKWVAAADAYWAGAMDASDGSQRIPPFWGTDAVHGHNHIIGATVFPHNIGLGAAANGDRKSGADLIRRIGRVTATEVNVTGLDWTFAPLVSVPRDDRWGRTNETFSEKTELTARLAAALVEGLQGDLAGPDAILATAKHWIGDGEGINGSDRGDVRVSEARLREGHAQGYFSTIQAGVQTIMIFPNYWNGFPNTAHAGLLTDVLKQRIGFDGIVLTDWNGIKSVPGCTASSCPEAVNAGVDMFMIQWRADWIAFIENTMQQVRDGVIPQSRIDDAVTRILRVKKRAGLFDKPRPAQRPRANDLTKLGSAEHRAVAREAVRKSLVLLKNKNGILPLRRETRVLVAGKSAHNLPYQTGGWTISWQNNGDSISTNADFPGATSIWNAIEAIALGAELDPEGKNADAAKHDVAIVVIGEHPYAEGQGDIHPGVFGGTEGARKASASRDIPWLTPETLEHARRYPEDLAVIERIAKAGVPVVTVLVSGRPLYVNRELNRSHAFVAAWLPGTEGAGIADVLFRNDAGKVNFDFSGKLSFSWPRHACQTAVNIGDVEYDPLFPFGYGLNYGARDTLGDKLSETVGPDGC